jgi:hypothetical protein
MSNVENLERALASMKQFGDAIDGNVGAVLKREIEKCQAEAVDLIPVDSGQGRAVLASSEAVDSFKDEDGNTWFRFGFIKPKMRTAKKRGGALHLFWVEFGTKYNPGKPRGTRTDKRGRVRKVGKGRRSSPARPAQPWFRPARSNLLRRVAELRPLIDALQAAKRATGLDK